MPDLGNQSPDPITQVPDALAGAITQTVPDGSPPAVVDAIAQGGLQGYTQQFKQLAQAQGQIAGKALLQAQVDQGKTADANDIEEKSKATTQANSDAQIAQAQAAARIAVNDELQQGIAAKHGADQAAQLGLTPQDFSAKNAQMKSIADDVSGKVGQLQEAQKPDFWSDPVNYLINHVYTIPHIKGQIQDQLDNAQAIQSTIADNTKQLVNETQADAVVNSVHTTERLAATAAQGAALAQAAGAKATLDGMQTQIGAAGLALRGSEATTSAEGTASSVLGAEGHSLLESEQSGYYDEAKKAQIAQRQAQTAKLQDDLQLKLKQNANDEAASQVFKGGLAQLGLPAIDLKSFKGSTQQRDAILNIGLNAGANDNQFGLDPVSAYKNTVAATGGNLSSLPVGHQATVRNLKNMDDQAQQDVYDNANKQGVKITDSDLKMQAAQAVQNRLIQAQKDISVDPTGFFKPANLETLVKAHPENKVLAAMTPMTEDKAGNPIKGVPTNFTNVLDTANKLVETKQMTEAQAVREITNLAQAAQDDNNKAYGYGRFAIPVQDRYNVGTTLANGQKQIVNYKDSTAVMKVLRLQRAQRLSQDQTDAQGNFLIR